MMRFLLSLQTIDEQLGQAPRPGARISALSESICVSTTSFSIC